MCCIIFCLLTIINFLLAACYVNTLQNIIKDEHLIDFFYFVGQGILSFYVER